MTWTSEKPTVAGWYWMRAPKHGWRDCVMWVEKDEDGFYIDVGDCDSEYVADIDGEWLGPITPDSYQQGHARAVRIVKKKIRSLEACIASDKRDGNEAGATLHVYALSILNSTLVEMQKGRA